MERSGGEWKRIEDMLHPSTKEGIDFETWARTCRASDVVAWMESVLNAACTIVSQRCRRFSSREGCESSPFAAQSLSMGVHRR